ncbi:MAG: type II toxin-antitoxin system RelE/ParE family toxin [Verrucomicrobiaceae bacterium]|nr:type II toxin-antitoxin system RelE/ParE family toxin [Verrucomicrobiaceae bacterium]
MKREVELLDRAAKDMASIPVRDGDRILAAITALASGQRGDVKKLKDFTPNYRLRVGDWRVLFEIENNKIVICRVLNRREAYR